MQNYKVKILPFLLFFFLINILLHFVEKYIFQASQNTSIGFLYAVINFITALILAFVCSYIISKKSANQPSHAGLERKVSYAAALMFTIKGLLLLVVLIGGFLYAQATNNGIIGVSIILVSFVAIPGAIILLVRGIPALIEHHKSKNQKSIL